MHLYLIIISYQLQFKMYTPMYTFSWSRFESCRSNSFQDLLDHHDFADVTLVTEDGKFIKAHKVVIASGSSVMKRMFMENPHPHPLIYLTGVKYNEIQSIVTFMYLGQVEVGQDDLNNFMEIAAKFQIKGLVEEHSLTNTSSETMSNDDLPVKNEKDGAKQLEINQSEEAFLNSFETTADEDVIETGGTLINEQKNLKHGLITESFPCNECLYVASDRSNLRKHKNAKHYGVKFPCEQCSYKASYSQHLKVDKRNKH